MRERIADTAQRLRMKKWHRLHLAQRRLSISMSSWCMSRNRVMFSSGFDESLSRILRSSSFWRDTYWWGIQSKMGNWKRTSKVSDFLAVCQFPLIQSSDSNSWDLREFGSSIEEHLGIEWKLVCLNHVKSFMNRNRYTRYGNITQRLGGWNWQNETRRNSQWLTWE